MRVLLITSSYYPYFSATALCARNLIKELKRSGHDILIISNMYSDYKSEEQKNVFTKYQKYLQSDNSKFIKKIYQINQYILKHLWKYSVNEELVKKIIDKYIEFKDQNKIDHIISTIYPIESAVAAYRIYKKYYTPYSILMFDKFIGSPTLHLNKVNRFFKRNSTKHYARKRISFALVFNFLKELL